MKIGGSCYKVLILPHVKRISVSLARRLRDYVNIGGTLISLGNPPSSGCGLIDREQKQQQVRESMKDIFGAETGCWHNFGNGRAIIVYMQAKKRKWSKSRFLLV